MLLNVPRPCLLLCTRQHCLSVQGMGPCRSKERQADTLIILDKSLARTAKHQRLSRAVRQFSCNAATASAMQLARAEDDEPSAALAVSTLAAAVTTSTDLQAFTSRPLIVRETERQATDEAEAESAAATATAAAVSAEPAKKKRTQAVTTIMQPPRYPTAQSLTSMHHPTAQSLTFPVKAHTACSSAAPSGWKLLERRGEPARCRARCAPAEWSFSRFPQVGSSLPPVRHRTRPGRTHRAVCWSLMRRCG